MKTGMPSSLRASTGDPDADAVPGWASGGGSPAGAVSTPYNYRYYNPGYYSSVHRGAQGSPTGIVPVP
jgi:hypothetical protein